MQNKVLNFISGAALFCALISPLIFFTNLTLNPFQAQIIILNIALFVFCLCNLGRVRFNKIDGVFFFFAGVLFLTWLLSLTGARYRISLFYNFFSYGSILFTWVLAYIAAKSLKEEQNITALNILFAVGGLAALYGVLQACGVEPIWPQSYNAGVISTFGNPNFLSAFLLPLVFPLIYFSLSDIKYKYFYAACLFVSLLFIIISGARSSILALVFGCVIMLFYKPLRALAVKNKKMVFIFLLLFVFVFFMLPQKSKNILISKTEEQAKIMRGDKNPQAYAQRKMLWSGAFNIFKSSHFAGKGWGSYYLYYGFEQGKMLFDNPGLQNYRVQSFNSHNFILQLAAESGIFGLSLFAVLFFGFAVWLERYFRREKKKDIIFFIAVSLIVFLIDNMFNITLFVTAPAFLFWFLAGMLSSEILEYMFDVKHYAKVIFIIIFGTFMVVSVKIFFSSVYQLKGFEFYVVKNYSAAQPYIDKSVKIYKGNYEAWFLKGNNETALGDNAAAFESYARAARLDPSYDEPLFNAAATAAALQNYAAAAEYAAGALRLNPGREFSYIILADAAVKTASLTPEEEKYLLHGLTLFGDNMTLCQNTGEAFLPADKAKAVEILENCAAADTLDKAVLVRLKEINPSSKIITQASSAQSLYSQLSKDGRPAENVISGVKVYAAQYPGDPNAALMLARAAYNAGDMDKALEILSSAVSKFPQNQSLQTALKNTQRK